MERMTDEKRQEIVSALQRLGAQLLMRGRAKTWKLTDESEMPAGHLARVLAKQKKISAGTYKAPAKIDSDIPPELVDEGWEILYGDRKSVV